MHLHLTVDQIVAVQFVHRGPDWLNMVTCVIFAASKLQNEKRLVTPTPTREDRTHNSEERFLPSSSRYCLRKEKLTATMGRCMICGCCCCYTGCDLDNMAICFKARRDCLCFRQSCCLDTNTKPRGVGCVGNSEAGECCKVGLYCCELGLITPKTLCAGVTQCLCLVGVISCPSDRDYVPGCACAGSFLQCAPKCGCCQE
jgi:hypothetical protein